MVGAGLFYIEHVLLPVLQLMLFVVAIGLVCVMSCGACCGSSDSKATSDSGVVLAGCGFCIYFLAILTMIACWLTVIIVTGAGEIHDTNGVPMKEW